MNGDIWIDDHPRTAFIADINRFLEHFQEEHHDIVLGGDWNNTIHDPPHSGAAKLCLQHDLLDPWITKYPNHQEIATFEFGSKRIDTIIVSPCLVPQTIPLDIHWWDCFLIHCQTIALYFYLR
jgi:hypothetical protein